MDVQQVASSSPRAGILCSGERLSVAHFGSEAEDGGAIEEFFGHLWWVPQSPPPRVSQYPPNLLWIHRDLWEKKSFKVKDCFPVQPGDVPRQDWKELDFAWDVWGKGERDSFLKVLKAGIAGRGGRGRGRVREG
jgi:hypothetical protein